MPIVDAWDSSQIIRDGVLSPGDLQLSNRDHTVSTSGVIATYVQAWSTARRNSSQGGRFYFEILVNLTPQYSHHFGIQDMEGVIDPLNRVTCGMLIQAGGWTPFVQPNPTTYVGTTLAPVGSQFVLCGTIDFVSKRAYFRINNGNWNNSVSANPVTITGGIPFEDSGWYMIEGFMNAPNGGTGSASINVGTRNFFFAPPSGAEPWFVLSKGGAGVYQAKRKNVVYRTTKKSIKVNEKLGKVWFNDGPGKELVARSGWSIK